MAAAASSPAAGRSASLGEAVPPTTTAACSSPSPAAAGRAEDDPEVTAAAEVADIDCGSPSAFLRRLHLRDEDLPSADELRVFCQEDDDDEADDRLRPENGASGTTVAGTDGLLGAAASTAASDGEDSSLACELSEEKAALIAETELAVKREREMQLQCIAGELNVLASVFFGMKVNLFAVERGDKTGIAGHL